VVGRLEVGGQQEQLVERVPEAREHLLRHAVSDHLHEADRARGGVEGGCGRRSLGAEPFLTYGPRSTTGTESSALTCTPRGGRGGGKKDVDPPV